MAHGAVKPPRFPRGLRKRANSAGFETRALGQDIEPDSPAISPHCRAFLDGLAELIAQAILEEAAPAPMPNDSPGPLPHGGSRC